MVTTQSTLPELPCPTNWRTPDKCHVFVLTGTHRCVLKLAQHNADTPCMCACGLEPDKEIEHRCSPS